MEKSEKLDVTFVTKSNQKSCAMLKTLKNRNKSYSDLNSDKLPTPPNS